LAVSCPFPRPLRFAAIQPCRRRETLLFPVSPLWLAQAAGQPALAAQLNDQLKLNTAGLPFHLENK